jgi:hypothetical protein
MRTEYSGRIRRFSPRRSTLARVLALSLLVLAASPFSAPFCTFDFAQFSHSMPAAGSTKVKASLDDATLGVHAFTLAAAPWDPAIGRPSGRANPISAHRSRHVVLRL